MTQNINLINKDDTLYKNNNQIYLNHQRQFSFETSSNNDSNLRSPSSSPVKNLNTQTKITPSKVNHQPNSSNDYQMSEVDLQNGNHPEIHNHIDSSIQQHQDSLISDSSYSLQKPPTNVLSHGYQSSISSVSSNGSIPSSPGLINYSPKHSRKLNSLHQNRNMKNLSLNLNDSNGSSTPNNSTTKSQQQQNNQKSNLLSKRNKLSMSESIDSPTRSQSINFIQPPPQLTSHLVYSEGALNTPEVTHTPIQPPKIHQQEHLNNSQPSSIEQSQPSNENYKFPPLAYTNNNNNNLAEYDSISSISDMKETDHNDILNERIIPPVQPPFAIGASKLSPLSTPPRLQSPIISNTQLHNVSTPTTKLSRNIKKMSIESPLETSFNKDEVNNKSSNDQVISENSFSNDQSTSQNITYNSNKFNMPEELQESTSINAYPNGPRNVLNNLIFLYSDPKNKIDINEYNLIINVAKECTNLSHLLHNQKPNYKEYIQIDWSHTSSISKDLNYLIEKIDSFYNKNLKILVHCQCGVSRSACVVVGYFMKKFDLGVNEAYEMLKNGTTTAPGVVIEKCDRICPNMSLIFELMEFGDKLNNKSEFTTNQILNQSPPSSIGI
ncbi:CPP1 [Candida jiufengensis]|uniref:CPP1 n=1 Tax=Candida jiufengensis TaxID=497108 RepID=UPI002224EC18|nr:CPP1 [Candida jiufengensis]KAI5951142.1 CPP1 [Candida jiufengensis]